MTRIAVLGAAGRMGKAIIRCAGQAEEISVVCAVEYKGCPAVGQDAGTVAEIGPIGITISDDNRCMEQADAVIDFTLHDAVPGNAAAAARSGKALVIGTTGLSKEETDKVRKASAVIPVVWAPNMSLGVNLLFAMVEKAARILGRGCRVTIDETHHVHKKDAPSGTALRLGQKVAAGLGLESADTMVHDPDGSIGTPPDGKILVRSHREGEVVGDHTVVFAGEGETVSLTHHAISRDAFAFGALHAAKWAVGRKPGLYDMQDVLGL